MNFFTNKWVHVLAVAIAAAAPLALDASGVPVSPIITALLTAVAGGVGARAGVSYAK